MYKHFPQIPNALVANHPFAINLLVHVTLLNPCSMSFTDFETLFLITDFEYFEGDAEDYCLMFMSNRNQ